MLQECGIRADLRWLRSEALPGRFEAFSRRFPGISASLGAVRQLGNHFTFRANVARGFRAPNLAELGSNGEHEGTFRYELFNHAFIALNLDWNMAQNHFFAAGGTETATPAYLLLGASAGTEVVIKGKTRLSLYIIGSNLTDQAYMPHLSRLKYMGIANMGRNVSFKMVLPF